MPDALIPDFQCPTGFANKDLGNQAAVMGAGEKAVFYHAGDAF